ncbi:hypothetical protein NPIL_5021 [Nephila pilipes]|uniref:Uncharacterized protein n=1 Tax=Nephila pilipes TaxID=299642 RepID=A0A8X6NTR5_NEPPI|nr:hypothetical protein NPIL_5021 [Nephila pilipes]
MGLSSDKFSLQISLIKVSLNIFMEEDTQSDFQMSGDAAANLCAWGQDGDLHQECFDIASHLAAPSYLP